MQAATLLGAASAIRSRIVEPFVMHERAELDAVEAYCRAALAPEAFARAWDEGAALGADAAAAWALAAWAQDDASPS